MSLFEAVFLGAVQGLTEFLPVSSSGHLVLFQHFLDISEADLSFDVVLHLGSLVAVFIYYRKKLLSLLLRPFQKTTYLIVVATVPAVVIGFLFKDAIEKLFISPRAAGFGLLFTGIVLMVSEKLKTKNDGSKKSFDEVSYRDALWVGAAQAVAIFPGVSRSGSTIAGGLSRNFDGGFAPEFSFLMSIPAILGANLFELTEMNFSGAVPSAAYLSGFFFSMVFGLLAIKVLIKIIEKGNLHYFSYYVWLVGITVLIFM